MFDLQSVRPSMFVKPSCAQPGRFLSPRFGVQGRLGDEDVSQLLAKIRQGEQDAWLTLYNGFKGYARTIANSWAGKLQSDREELFDAATFGVTMAIEAVKANPEEWQAGEGFNKVLNRHIMRQINAAKGANPFAESFDAPLPGDDSGGDRYAIVGTEEMDDEERAQYEKKLEIALKSLPALNILEEAVIVLTYGLNDRLGSSTQEIADRLGVSLSLVGDLKESALDKMTARYKWYSGTRQSRAGTPVPYHQLTPVEKLLDNKRQLFPILKTHWQTFTAHEQQLLRLLFIGDVEPDAAAKQLDITPDTLSGHADNIIKRLRVVMGTAEVNLRNKDDVILLRLQQETGLATLSKADLGVLSYDQRQVLQHEYVDGMQPDEIAQALKMSADRVRELKTEATQRWVSRKGATAHNFTGVQGALLSGMAPVLDVLSAEQREVFERRMIDEQPINEIAEALGGIAPTTVKGRLYGAKALVQRHAHHLTSLEKIPEETPVCWEQVAKALEQEGLVGVRAEHITGGLTELQRSVFLYRYKGWSHREIAHKLGRHESPVKAAARSAIDNLQRLIKQPTLPKMLENEGLVGVSHAQIQALPLEDRFMIMQYLERGHRLKSFFRNLSEDLPVEQKLTRLCQHLNNVFETLPPVQRGIMQSFRQERTSVTDLAKRLGKQMTVIASTTRAGFINLEKGLCPVTVIDWLNDHGFASLKKQDLVGLSPLTHNLFQAYLEKEGPMDKFAVELESLKTPAEIVQRMEHHVTELLDSVAPSEKDDLGFVYRDGKSIAELITERGGKPEILESKVSAALFQLSRWVGELPLLQVIERQGAKGIDQLILDEVIERSEFPLEGYLRAGNSLGLLAERVSRVTTREDKLNAFEQSLAQAMQSLTARQHEVLRAYRLNNYSQNATARALTISGHSVKAVIDLAYKNLSHNLHSPRLSERLQTAGLSRVEDSQIDVLPRLTQNLLTRYLASGHSLTLPLRLLSTQPDRTLANLEALMLRALSGLKSEQQREALRLICETEANYPDIAERIGIGRARKNNIGTLIQAALKNISLQLDKESTIKALLAEGLRPL